MTDDYTSEEIISDQNNTLPTLSNQDTVHRAITSDYWIDKQTGELKKVAFRRRESEQHGLSVLLPACWSVERIITSAKELKVNEVFGVGSLIVGQVREIGLEVEPDRPDHANITGIPSGEDDEAKAMRESFANELAKISTNICESWPNKKSKKKG